jgi:hypothetical protein
MSESKVHKNVVHLGLDLGKIDLGSLEELSTALEDYLMKSLRSLIGSRVDINLSVELEVGETLDLAVDLVVQSPNPLPPDILAEIDERVDRAIRKFEEITVLRYGLRKS